MDILNAHEEYPGDIFFFCNAGELLYAYPRPPREVEAKVMWNSRPSLIVAGLLIKTTAVPFTALEYIRLALCDPGR